MAGALIPGYDPLRQAISETFALGAPPVPATLVRASLVVSGVALVAFAWALDRGLPGQGRTGPVLCAVAGVLTLAVAAVPCTDGCPGAGTTLLDTLHVGIAGTGYLALIATPLVVAGRIRGHAPRLARWSVALGGLALAGFLTHTLGVGLVPGLSQRVFNTVADLWFVLAAVWLLRRYGPVRARPPRHHDVAR